MEDCKVANILLQGSASIQTETIFFFTQVQLKAEVLRTPNLTILGFELMTSRS